MVKCDSCRCKPVCKEIENWKKYCEDHIRLRERSVLFDSEPECPYYTSVEEPKSLKDRYKEHISKVNEKDKPCDIDELFRKAPKITYDWKTDDLELDTKVMNDIKEEIMATVEDGLRSVGKSSEEYTKETYDFVKELQKIAKQNGIYYI